MRRRLCPKEALFTPSFIAVCSANLLFFIASFMMVPVLPIYLLDGLHASKSVVGIILSAYMIGALVMRPLSGGPVPAQDTVPRLRYPVRRPV